MVAFVMDEDLRLVHQAAEGVRMDDAIAVALEGRAQVILRLGIEPPARLRGIASVTCPPALAMAEDWHLQLRHARPTRLTRLDTVLSYNTLLGKSDEAEMDQASVTLTDRAARRIARILGAEPAGTALRVSVEGGGCSGFQYRYDLEPHAPGTDDVILSREGATVLIDPVSLQYMGGAEIDFVDDLIGQSFQIRNPLATASCGCGTSFSI
jgi:iron-sulfur cluster assembly accessory protein